MKNKLFIFSIDALNAKDLDYIKELTHFKPFFEEGSYVKEVDAVYPTLTYCCHTSIITGNYPDVHGIFHNEVANPKYNMVQDWFWFKKDIKTDTLFDLAIRQKLSCASLLWPVMASAGKAIKYNVPEIWSDRGESSTKLFLKHGSLKMLPSVLKHQKKLKGKQQPYLDNFTEALTIETIIKKKPDLLTVHFTELDTMRHIHGVFSPEAYKALDSINQRLGHIIEAIKKASVFESTNIILLGDHGGNDFDKMILLNSLFHKEGLLELDSDGTIKDWKAYGNNAGGSIQVHLKDPMDTQLYNQVKSLLTELTEMDNSPIKHLFSSNETRVKEHLFGTYSFVLEAKDGYIFRNHIKESLVIDRTEIEGAYHCDHGFLPSHENLKTLFIAKGPAINKGVVVPHCCLVDEGPTLAKLLDLEFTKCDGHVINELLK